MTVIEIWKAKRKLYEIQKEPEISKQLEPLKALAKRVGASIPHILVTRSGTLITNSGAIPSSMTTPLEDEELVNEIIRNIHIVLQTEMMLQACIFAAVSAIVACTSIVLLLFGG